MSWDAVQVPLALKQAYWADRLPMPDYIQEQMAVAWGFDFYQPARLMLMRFDRWFDQGYVRGTLRHETF